ncbi:Zinc finger DPH-type [Macrophomina phaseolina MS6]|uniref:Zinc finger DPH-type n=1 Tax=Macrophomina phaseolina (strain MS6) TaxID=1126212 RepID=K2S9Y2_MACPH|nr:Zinc finger DPH-type [Macrophomina phaseolina MS6]
MEYDTPEKVAALAEIDPQLAEILKTMPIPSGRPLIDAFIAKSHAFQPSPETATEHIIHIPMRDGHLNPARVHKPATPAANSPLIILIHGGGYCAGDYEQPTPTARTLARLFSATAVTISHRLAPTHRFPVAAHDALDAVRWLALHARSDARIGADPSAGFVVGGGSSGAALAGVVVQQLLGARDEGEGAGRGEAARLPPVTGVWMQMPSHLDPRVVPPRHRHLHFAREQNRDAPVLNAESLAYLKELYRADVMSELFSPVNAEGFLKGEEEEEGGGREDAAALHHGLRDGSGEG